MKKRINLFAAVAFALLVLAAPRILTAQENTLNFERYVEPVVNRSLYLDLKGSATIDIAVLFDDTGRVDDWLPLRTNDRVLISSVRNVIDQWKIVPPIWNGEPSWSYHVLTLTFRQSGAIVNISTMESVLTFFNLMKDDFQLVVPFRELDNIPKPVSLEKPSLHRSLSSANSGKSVKFEIFIDENGNVRMPIVKESETETVVTAILMESLLKWKFEPPRKRGSRVATRAIVPFTIE